jgi:crossover junction endodeoxyribonuclease RusA
MIRFFVPGVPAPGGSKKSFRSASTGKVITMEDCKRTAGWRSNVAGAAAVAMVGRPGPLTGPLRVQFFFSMPRPKSHYGTGKNARTLKATAPIYHTTKPDTTKLIRSTEDACSRIVWSDDAVIAEQSARKVYTNSTLGHSTPGAIILVTEL